MAKKPKKLRDMEITAIALVGKPANRRRFLMFKADRETVSKPYSGPGDKSLPDNVKELPKEKRDAWVKAFNNAWENYDKEKDKNYDPDRTLAQNKERYCFAVANAVVKEKTEKGGDEVEEIQTMTVKLDASGFEEQVDRFAELLKSLGSDEEIEKKGAVLNKENMRLLREIHDRLGKVLASAGVEKEEGDPPQEEPEEKVEVAEEPTLIKEKIAELEAEAEKVCTPEKFEAMVTSAIETGGEKE